MSNGIIRLRGGHKVWSGGAQAELTVGETWVGEKKSPTDEQLTAVQPLAEQIHPYLQEVSPDLTPERLAYIMSGYPGFSVAYSGYVAARAVFVPKVLAFAYVEKIGGRLLDTLRGRTADYVFRQFGVTSYENVRQLDPLKSTLYLGAVAATLYHGVRDLPPAASVYMRYAEGDSRSQDFFRHAGFRLAAEAPAWDRGDFLLEARAGDIPNKLLSSANFAFLGKTL